MITEGAVVGRVRGKLTNGEVNVDVSMLRILNSLLFHFPFDEEQGEDMSHREMIMYVTIDTRRYTRTQERRELRHFLNFFKLKWR